MKNDSCKSVETGAILSATLVGFLAVAAISLAGSTASRNGEGAQVQLPEHQAHSLYERENQAWGAASDPIEDPTPTTYDGFGAQSADYFEQPTFVSDYFANLTKHFPTNNSGNCGYTAAAMLLSYYDVYWNRNIIPDQFNDLAPSPTHRDDNHYSSPGVNDYYAPVWTEINPKMDPPKEGDRESDYALKYYENEREAYSRYLDYMLARTGDNIISELYHIALDPSVNVYVFDREPRPLLSHYGLVRVVNRFLSNYGLSCKIEAKYVFYLDIDSGSANENEQIHRLRELAVERLKVGQPIVVFGQLSSEKYGDGVDGGGNQTSDGKHAAIAYEYCDDGNMIGHMGWKGREEYSRLRLDKEFDYIYAFAYLDISTDLEFTQGNNRFYDHGPIAATDLSSHMHGNRVTIDYGDSNFHALQCVCGDVLYERHINTTEQHDAQYHRVYCPTCGREELVEHTITRIPGVGFGCQECGLIIAYDDPWAHL